MKKAAFFAFLVFGSVLIVAVIVPVVYAWMGHYFQQDDRRFMMEMARQKNAALVAAFQAQVSRQSPVAQPFVPPGLTPSTTPAAPPSSSPPLLTLPFGAKTENDYIAQVIARDIYQQAFLSQRPNQAVPDPNLIIHVDWQHAPYHVGILGQGIDGSPLNMDLAPAFAWDALEYSKWAAAVLGSAKASGSDPLATTILSELLEPTGAKIAKEDVRLSALLQQDPLNVDAHEEAALILISMALRENAGHYSDLRRFLCRATAHLALADALHGGKPSWNNRLADVAIRVIAGREVDAAPRLDELEQESDCPSAAKSWLEALKIWNRDDVTGVTVTAASPRLVKIAWFQTLTQTLPILVATSRWDELGTPDSIVDWTRAVASAGSYHVETGSRFADAAIAIEFQELGEILNAEQVPDLDMGHLNRVFAEPEADTVTNDAAGHPRIQVIGLGSFKASARRHLFNALEEKYDWLVRTLGDPEGAKTFRGQTLALFEGVPYFEMPRQILRGEGDPYVQLDAVLRSQNKAWPVTELPPVTALADLVGDQATADLARNFYSAGPPFGTVFGRDLTDIFSFLKIDSDWHRDPANVDPHANLRLLFDQQLAAMKPDSVPIACQVLLVQHDLTADEVIARLSPFFNRNVHAILFVNDWNGRLFNLSDAQHESLLKSWSDLDPDALFAYGNLLWNQNRQEEAAAVYRRAVASAHDQVGMSNSVYNLVTYDYDHGKKDEAMQIAKNAADVFSQQGLFTYMTVLEKAGDFANAEKQALAIRDRYDSPDELTGLYARHPDEFPGKFDALVRQAFPNGIGSVTVASFTGQPQSGVQFIGSSPLLEAAGISDGDVVVALDGSKVDNEQQYELIRARSQNPMMDLIVWQHGTYNEIKTAPPNRRFSVDIKSYVPASP